MERSTFRVVFANATVGSATLTGKAVRFRPDEGARQVFERQSHGWLMDFQAVVRRLVKSTGHFGRYSITEDEDSGITVVRL